MTKPNELYVEDQAAKYFVRGGLPSILATEIDPLERGSSAEIVLRGQLKSSLQQLNPHLPFETIEEVARTLSRPPHPTLLQNNRWFHTQLTDGVEVTYRDIQSGEMRGGRAKLIDFDHPYENEFLMVRQLTVTGPSGKSIRPDLTLFLNGLPILLIELKNPLDVNADLNMAIDQFARYKETAPDLFVPNLLLVASDGMLTRVGSITSGRQRFTPWRPESGGEPTLEALIHELLNPEALLDYLRSCVAFEEDERGNIVKKVAGYHQFRAVRKTRAQVIAAQNAPTTSEQYNGKPGGVVWHTQARARA